MQVKVYLEKYDLISSEVLRLQAEMNALIREKTDTYNTLKAYAMSQVPGKSGRVADPVSSTVENLVDRYDNKIAFYADRINRIIDEKAFFDDIWSDLSLLSNEERTIVSLRYFNQLPWEKISRKTSYCEKQCHRILIKAIDKLQATVDQRLNLE